MEDLHTIPLAEAPSGLPEDQDEPTPLGVPEADPDHDAPHEPQEEDLPGIAGDDPPSSG
jgi:hypothetical protein